eukprot:scaffold5500_cov248-Pinguiococcus_pyrenoidosus.AAC.3
MAAIPSQPGRRHPKGSPPRGPCCIPAMAAARLPPPAPAPVPAPAPAPAPALAPPRYPARKGRGQASPLREAFQATPSTAGPGSRTDTACQAAAGILEAPCPPRRRRAESRSQLTRRRLRAQRRRRRCERGCQPLQEGPQALGLDRALQPVRCWWEGEFGAGRDPVPHLRRHEHANALPRRDSSHAICSLEVVPQRHVLAHGQHGRGRRGMLDVHARRMDLVVEGKASLQRNARVLQIHHTARGPDQNLLLIRVIRVSGDERSGVYESIARGGLGQGGNAPEDRERAPACLEHLEAHDIGIRERAHDPSVRTLLVATLSQREREKVTGRPAEPNPHAKEDVAPELLSARAELEVLEAHALRQHQHIQEPADSLCTELEEMVKTLHLPHVALLQHPKREHLSFRVDATVRGGMVSLVSVLLPFDLSAGFVDPVCIELCAPAQVERPGLLLEV